MSHLAPAIRMPADLQAAGISKVKTVTGGGNGVRKPRPRLLARAMVGRDGPFTQVRDWLAAGRSAPTVVQITGARTLRAALDDLTK